MTVSISCYSLTQEMMMMMMMMVAVLVFSSSLDAFSNLNGFRVKCSVLTCLTVAATLSNDVFKRVFILLLYSLLTNSLAQLTGFKRVVAAVNMTY